MLSVLLIAGQIGFSGVLWASTAGVEPNFEKFMAYFETNYRQHKHSDVEDDKIAKTISSILHVSGISAIQKQKLLFKLGQIHLHRYEQGLQNSDTKIGRGMLKSVSKSLTRNLIRAANAFRQVIKIRGNKDIVRTATLNLALTLSRLRNGNAVFYYRKLLSQVSDRELLPYINLALAEHLVVAKKYQQAEKYYKKAVGYKEHPAYLFSVYKLGWVYYHLHPKDKKLLTKSIKSFQLAIHQAEKTEGEQAIAIKKDAVSDLSYIWSELKDVAAARKFFLNIGERTAYYFTLKRVAQLYEEQGDKKKAIIAYKMLWNSAGHLLESPEYLQKLLQLLFDTGKYQHIVRYLQKVEQRYVNKNSSWYTRNRNHPNLAELLQFLSETVYQYGKYLYELGDNPQKADVRKYARSTLKIYLKTFPDSNSYLDARFLLAEILVEFNYLERAAKHFIAVSNDSDRDDPLSKMAALNAVSAIEKLMQSNVQLENDGIETSYREALDNYLHLFPEDKESKAILLSAAKLELKFKNTVKARNRLQSLIEVFPESTEAEQATGMLFAIIVEKKEWRELIAWVDRYYNPLKLRLTSNTDKLIMDNYKLANYRLALQLQEDKKYREAAQQFLQYQKLFPDDKLADDAMFLAGENHYKANDIDAAINSHSMLVDKYPDSDFVKEALLTLAQTHEKIGLFAMAARYYHTYGLRFTKSRYNYKALTKSMKYYFYLNMMEDALLIADYINNKFKGLPQEFYVTLAEIYVKAEKYEDAWDIYQRLIINPHLAAGTMHNSTAFLDILRDNGQRNRLDYIAQKLQPRVHDGLFKDIFAKIKFDRLILPLQEFITIDVSDPGQIDEVVKIKQKKLLQLVAEFEKIIKIEDIKYQVASFYKLGEMHENFANMIFNAPSLIDASQEEIDRYRTRLEKAAFPLKNEAYKYYHTAWQKAQKKGIFDKWMLKSYEKITQLYPEKHPKIIEKVNTPFYLTHKFHLSDSTKILLR